MGAAAAPAPDGVRPPARTPLPRRRGLDREGRRGASRRDLGVRATIDIDVFRNLASETAERELREAAGKDIGDWFRFEVGPPRAVRDGAATTRLPVRAYIGTTEWAAFHVDLAGPEVTMTGEPDKVPALARVVMPDIEQHGYRAYPLVDHIADKVVATFDRYGDTEAPSSRYKDLVDLVAIVTRLRSRRSRRRQRSPRRPSGAASRCPRGLTCPRATCGTGVTRRKPAGRSCRRPAHWTKRWPSSVLSSTRSSMVRPTGGGIPRRGAGALDRTNPEVSQRPRHDRARSRADPTGGRRAP